jgi:branched-chain amino acid aminotransferase
MFGSGPRVGVQPANEYTFIAMVVPAGSYYAGGLGKPVDGLIMSDYDRAAPKGVGGVKVAGNYAADMLPSKKTKDAGYQIALYLDARTQESIEEFSTSSFVGINTAARKYVTPQSASVLRSVTNKSLMQLAADMEGWTAERRDISVKELASFDEVMAVGTGVVVTPVGSITQLLQEGESKVFEPGRSSGHAYMAEGKCGRSTLTLAHQW